MDRTHPRQGGLSEQIDRLRPGIDAVAGPQWERTGSIVDRFGRFAADGFGLFGLEDVTPTVARLFVAAPTSTGELPSTSTMHWRFDQMIAHASMNEMLVAGEIFGSGTVGGGSAAEVGKTLAKGDKVVLTMDRLGTLSNVIG